MKRGDLYRVYRGSKYDPKNYRAYVIVSQQKTIDSGFSSVICAPIYTNSEGYPTQLAVGIDEGLKHESAICCDELMSIRKTILTNYIGKLSVKKLIALNDCLAVALALDA
jgi:mRNA interferase MazF